MTCPRSRRACRALARLALAGAASSAATAAGATRAQAQVNVVGRQASLAPAVAPSLGISVTWGGQLAIPAIQDDARNDFPSPVTISVSWTGMTTPTTLCAVGYFQNPAAALASAGDAIAASVVHGRVTGGQLPTTPYTPFTQAGCTGGVGTNGGSLRLIERTLTGDGSTSATLQLRLDLTGSPAVPPGVYVGTLNIRAIVQ